MSDLFFRKPRLTILVIGLILVAGASALDTLPRQEDPALARRFGTVTTFYPGASALRVESLVTEPIESELLELHEIREIESVSRTGISVLRIVLEDQYREEDVDEVWSRVRDKLADATPDLPAGASVPEFEDQTSTAITVLAGLVWEGDGPPELALLGRLATELENRLRQIAGTRKTEIYGEPSEEILVRVDPANLAAINLTAGDLSAAVRRADVKVPAGTLRERGSDLVLEVSGELDSLERVRSVPIRQSSDGRLLRLGDIAEVSKTVLDPPLSIALLGGRRGVAVGATMDGGQRVDRWSEKAHAVIEAFREDVPTGVRLELLFDQSIYTNERLGSLTRNLALGSAIVIVVLVFMMGLRSALIVAIALPLTLAMVLAEFSLLGVPLHQTSLTGLIIALGLLIDNAIVVVDEFETLRKRGKSPADSIRRVVRLLMVPLSASTLTTVLAFLPIVLMPGGAGEFVGPIAIGVGLSVTSSFLLSMTIIPTLAAFLAPREVRIRQGASKLFTDGFSHAGLRGIYRRTLVATLRRPELGIAVSLVLPILGFLGGSTLPQQFFPANDRDQFQIQLVLPPQTAIAATEARALRAREIVHAHPEVLESHWFLGESAPRVYYNMFNNEDRLSSFAGAFVTTTGAKATEALLPRLQRELTDAFPDARIIALPFEQGPPFEAPIELRIVGPDLDELREIGDQTRVILDQTEGVTFTTSKQRGGVAKLVLRTDEDVANRAGIQLSDVAEQLEAQLEGVIGGSILEASEELPVRVRVGDADRRGPAGLSGRQVLAPNRGMPDLDAQLAGVPLASLARFDLEPEFSGVNRRNGERTNTVQAFLVPYQMISESLADFQTRLDAANLLLPAGYRIEFGGEDEERAEAMSKLGAFAIPLFVLMAGSIILSFNSFRLALIIFGVAGLSVGLALGGVFMFGYPFGFVAIVGTMGLVGLAINDAIVVLTTLVSSEGARRGDVEVTADVVVGATRHILATTLTTIGGFFPLIVFGGRFWPPMATAIAGGIIGCSILALYFVPPLHRLTRRRYWESDAEKTGTPSEKWERPRRSARSVRPGGLIADVDATAS